MGSEMCIRDRGNTPEMGIELLTSRVEENVRRYISGDPLLGQIDLELGY